MDEQDAVLCPDLHHFTFFVAFLYLPNLYFAQWDFAPQDYLNRASTTERQWPVQHVPALLSPLFTQVSKRGGL